MVVTLALTSSSSVATRQSSSKLGSALAAPSVLGQGRDGERDISEAAERQAERQPTHE